MNEIKVTKIDALPVLKQKTKVAAYARVSSDKDAMLHSLSAQISYYNKLIQSNEDWLFVGIYADEGISGTKTNRPEFNRMVQDAKNGKIDLIITKSISRFARNTTILLETIRDLKKLNINVFFEEQNIYTLSAEGELMITLMASLAQEEAHSMSENVKWRARKDMEKGILYGGNGCYGYKLVGRDLVVEPKQAEVVKRIFKLYIEGNGDTKIARILNDDKVPTFFEGAQWHKATVKEILENINYTGDIILQKTYRENYLVKKTRKNTGQKQRYYVEDHHEPIIDKKTFELAQKIRTERISKMKSPKESKTYPFTGLIICGTCGAHFGHKIGPYTEFYQCRVYDMYGKSKCTSKRIRDDVIEKETCKVLGMDKLDEKVLREKIEKITIYPNNTINYLFKDGTTKIVIYNDPSRSEGWTPEMKEKARIKSSKQIKPKGADGRWQKLQ